MAIFHLSAKIIGRSRGRMATAAAAYRAGVRIRDERTGLTFDYSRRKYVAWSAIAAPSDAPEWVWDRERLWNHAEHAEKRRDAQVAREIEVALPRELDYSVQLKVVSEFIEAEFTARGMVVDACFHNNPNNPHCHLLISLRALGRDGFGAKVTEWNDRRLLNTWRESWAIHCNNALAKVGIRQRIDHRSLLKQGIKNRVATRHEGVRRTRLSRALARGRDIYQKQKEEQTMMKETANKSIEPNAEDKSVKFSGGISPVDPKKGAESRNEVATAEYQNRIRDVFDERLNGLQYFEEHHSLHIRVRGGSLRDFGNRIVPKFGGLDAEIATMVKLAQLKGWEKIYVSGGDHCRRSLWREAVLNGFQPNNIFGYTPDSEDLSLIAKVDAAGGETNGTCSPKFPPTSRRPTLRR